MRGGYNTFRALGIGGGSIGGVEGSNGVINYDRLAAKVAQANRSLPSPVVSVEEINRVGKRVAVIETVGNF